MNSTLVRRASTMRLSSSIIRRRPVVTSLSFGPQRIMQHVPHQQRFFAGAAATVTVPSCNRNDTWWTTALATAAVAGGSMMVLGGVNSNTSCEEAPPPPAEEETDAPPPQEELEEEEDYTIGPDDPYYNIPDQDEPTDCSMCLTFRQGPCRVDWKRFELCVKDKSPPPAPKKDDTKEDSSDTQSSEQQSAAPTPAQVEDPTACMKYAMPFYHCSSKHVNSYLIIGNDQTQQTVTGPLMDTYNADKAKGRRLCFADLPEVDWTNWETFVRTLRQLGGSMPTKFQLEQSGFDSPADALRATWKDSDGKQYLMMNDEGEPFLITVTVPIPLEQPVSGTNNNDNTNTTAPLMMTYALDQKGNLVGDARNSTDEEDNKDNNNGDESASEKETPTHLPLQVQIVPGVTQEVTIYALYVPEEGSFLDDGTLYESKPYKLQTITHKVMEQTKQEMAEKEAPEKEQKARIE